jgi:hypothetical protein
MNRVLGTSIGAIPFVVAALGLAVPAVACPKGELASRADAELVEAFPVAFASVSVATQPPQTATATATATAPAAAPVADRCACHLEDLVAAPTCDHAAVLLAAGDTRGGAASGQGELAALAAAVAPTAADPVAASGQGELAALAAAVAPTAGITPAIAGAPATEVRPAAAGGPETVATAARGLDTKSPGTKSKAGADGCVCRADPAAMAARVLHPTCGAPADVDRFATR